MEIDDNLGCGLIEIKLLNTAHVMNLDGDTIFQYSLVQDEMTKQTKEVVVYENRPYIIYSRIDSYNYTIYLASEKDDSLIIYIKNNKVEYIQKEKSLLNSYLIEHYLK